MVVNDTKIVFVNLISKWSLLLYALGMFYKVQIKIIVDESQRKLLPTFVSRLISTVVPALCTGVFIRLMHQCKVYIVYVNTFVLYEAVMSVMVYM